MAIRSSIARRLSNAAHASHRSQMVAEHHVPTSRHPDTRLRADKANNTLSIVDSGIGMSEQGLADIVRTKDSNGCQYNCESMKDSSFQISKDDNAEQVHKGTEVMLSQFKNQLEYLEEKVIKDPVEKECGSVGNSIDLKVEKEPELNEGEIQEDAKEWQVIHEPKALGPSNNPLVANDNMEAEAGAKDPSVILCTIAQSHLRGKVDNAIIAEPGSFEADMPCRIKNGILEMNPNNEDVKKLIKAAERGEREAVEVAVGLLLNKLKKPVWKRMIDRLRTCCVIVDGILDMYGLLEGFCS